MKNESNIYDIDGDLLRAAGDNHQWTIEEAKSRIQHYQGKLKELYDAENPTKEDLQKIKIYESYCKNLMNYSWRILMSMGKDEFTEYLTSQMPEQPDKTTENAVEEALNQLKNDVETRENTEDEISGTITTNTGSTTDEESGNVEVVERTGSGVQEKRSVSQSDLLVERDNVTPTVMDEYVEYTEE